MMLKFAINMHCLSADRLFVYLEPERPAVKKLLTGRCASRQNPKITEVVALQVLTCLLISFLTAGLSCSRCEEQRPT